MTIAYPDNTASRTPIVASGLTDSTALLDVYSGGERSLTLAELKKTGVQVLNAKQYGLRGDGITDDTTQFLLFCSGAASSNLVAYFPPGTYLLNSLPTYGYQISSNFRVLGENATLKGDSTSGHDEPFTLISGADFTCEGITFDTFYIPIWAESTFNGKLKVAGCKFTNCEIGIASSTATPSKISIINNEFTGYLHKGVAWLGISNAHVLVSDNLLYDASGSNIQSAIQIGDNGDLVSKSIIIEKNKIRNHIRTTTGTVIGIVSYGYMARIEQNTLENVQANAGSNGDSEAGIYSKTHVGSISNNTLINAGRGNGCIVWKGGFISSNISNNNIIMSDSTYNDFIGIRAYCANCSITNNILNGSGSSVDSGILLGDSNGDRKSPKNITINNNIITDCVHSDTTGRAIVIPGGMDITVINNTIRRCGTSAVGALAYGIDISQTSDMQNIRIINNTLDSPAFTAYSYAIRSDSSTSGNIGLSIDDNIISGYHCGPIINSTTTTGYWSTVSICNNNIDAQQASGTGVTSIGITAFNIRNGKVSGNIIRNIIGDGTTQCGGIKIWSGITNGISNILIKDNMILNIASLNQYYGYGINVYDNNLSMSGVYVTDNTVNLARRGILFQSTSGIKLNMIDNNLISITGVNAGDDYTFVGPADSVIDGNMEDLVLHSINTASLLTAAPIFLKSSVALTQGSGASTATLTNAPAAGNPTKWIPINDNGTTRYIPCW